MKSPVRRRSRVCGTSFRSSMYVPCMEPTSSMYTIWKMSVRPPQNGRGPRSYPCNGVCLEHGVCPRHHPRFEPSIILGWIQLFTSTHRSAANADLLRGPFQLEIARSMGIDILKDFDMDTDCHE